MGKVKNTIKIGVKVEKGLDVLFFFAIFAAIRPYSNAFTSA